MNDSVVRCSPVQERCSVMSTRLHFLWILRKSDCPTMERTLVYCVVSNRKEPQRVTRMAEMGPTVSVEPTVS